MTQDEAISKLERDGWQFRSWISAQDPEHPDDQVAVMMKKPNSYTTHYCEVNPDGSTT